MHKVQTQQELVNNDIMLFIDVRRGNGLAHSELRSPRQAEAESIALGFRVAAVPYAYSAVIRVEPPTTAAYNTASALRGTLRIGNDIFTLISVIV